MRGQGKEKRSFAFLVYSLCLELPGVGSGEGELLGLGVGPEGGQREGCSSGPISVGKPDWESTF